LNKSDLETKTETKIEIVDSSNVEVKFDIERNTFTIEAKDNLKPFTYAGKTYFNAVLRQDNIKDKSLYRKENKIAYKDDSQIVGLTFKKKYSSTPRVVVYIDGVVT
jgi:Holliday junction resolvase RusA-like endonuclease